MAKKKKNRKSRPPCPDPERYTWVNTKDGGGYWRLFRGTNKEAVLNNVLQLSANITRQTNQAAKRVMHKLQPYLQHLMTGRTTMRIAGAFKKAIFEHDKMDYSHLMDLDFQKTDYPFGKLVTGYVTIKEEKGVLHANLALGNDHVKKHSSLSTGYYAEIILLFGDPDDDKGLRIDSTQSDPFFFANGKAVMECLLSIQLPPKQPWMVLLKISCLGKEVQETAKYKALKVVRVGKGSL
jgi:hypothetical protein